ncbi:putative calmodulin-binding transcription activator 1 [Cocos nucifera]|uniref:Putative calmodulin-binding transcription activator 1 n=1 Tax=Cocos nucifera TaxID=13894 RepID=A0A8K0N0X2_COCNU|nr:putative calmodulin-binding transcription activator 1 [Cocos nucifera]
MQRRMADSASSDHRMVNHATYNGYGTISSAYPQIFTGVVKRNDQMKEENADNVNSFDDKCSVNESTHMYQMSHDHRSHIASQFKNNMGSRMNISVPDQPLEYEAEVSNASKKPLQSDAHNNEHEDLKRLDSFGRWMNKEIGKDCDDSLMASDSCNYWNALDSQNDDKEVSSLSRHMRLDIDSLGPVLLFHKNSYSVLLTSHLIGPILVLKQRF